MAKNTRSFAFRKIDVDEFNEDNYKEDEPVELHSPVSGPDEKEIAQLLNQGKGLEALRSCLKNAPLGSKSQQLKDNATTVTLRVLMTIKSSQIEEAVQSLDPEMLDVLMKYIYRGFEIPSEGSSAHLLSWHEKAFAVGGLGCISRVLTDRKRV
ncbi:actin-related protein 2/3 complex subunit 5-B [Folsomia candida]|uniref:actin-related protein 2/3 complex subunit 5-B n=1 Tax=Folsomia candida TaxID=158441 RepID=UPI000B8F5FB8|nr:actin-related protein 2/3 complex subunit 5-B [Folsomia candida]